MTQGSACTGCSSVQSPLSCPFGLKFGSSLMTYSLVPLLLKLLEGLCVTSTAISRTFLAGSRVAGGGGLHMHDTTARIDTVLRIARFFGACAATLYVAAAATTQAEDQQPAPPPVSAMTPGLSVQQLAQLRGVIFAHGLEDIPGKNLVVVNLQFPPNAPRKPESSRCGAHHHPGSVWVYVTKGTARMGLAGEPVQVVHAGQSFYEPPGSTHTVGESASATEPVSAIAVMIVPDGAPLVTPASCKEGLRWQ